MIKVVTANILKMSTITSRCLMNRGKYAQLRLIFEAVAFWYAVLGRSQHFAAHLSILRQLRAECLRVSGRET